MTEPSPGGASERVGRRPVRRVKPSAIPVFAALAALAIGSFAYLTVELAGGRDPALGSDAIAAVTPKRPIVIRKVIRRKVVTTVVPAPTTPSYTGGSSSYGGYSSGGTSYSAPSTSYAAPAPAPAPAPVVTASS